MDLHALLAPREASPPSGDNLEYDPVFTEMELAAQPVEERQIGDEVTAAEDPDYREMKRTALDVMARSHDLRAGVVLADAALRLDDLESFAEVTAYLRGCVEQYWDSCHPQLDEDDDDDPTMRINALQGLCGQPGGLAGPSPVYTSLRRTALTQSRGFGRFSLREIEIAEGINPAPPDMENPPDTGTIGAAFQDSDDGFLSAMLAAAQQAGDDIKAISAAFDDNTPGQGPEFVELVKLLSNMERRLVTYGGAGAAAPETRSDDEDEAAAPPVAAGFGMPQIPGSINSTADVAAALDRIIAYYHKNEPSSPIPILLERAKRLVNADFLTIIKDMAPHGLDTVQTIGGLEDEDDD